MTAAERGDAPFSALEGRLGDHFAALPRRRRRPRFAYPSGTTRSVPFLRSLLSPKQGIEGGRRRDHRRPRWCSCPVAGTTVPQPPRASGAASWARGEPTSPSRGRGRHPPGDQRPPGRVPRGRTGSGEPLNAPVHLVSPPGCTGVPTRRRVRSGHCRQPDRSGTRVGSRHKWSPTGEWVCPRCCRRSGAPEPPTRPSRGRVRQPRTMSGDAL